MSIRRIKVLMIEDDQDQIQLYGTKFRLEGYDFIFGNDGNDGLKLAKEQNPDIVLLDIMLYEEDGIEVLKKIKQDQKTKNIPVIIFSNLDKKEIVDKAFTLGAVDYIIKSKIVPSEIVEKVAEITKNKI
ncbi:response regulator [Patescibacteria group bacterium]|nr:response regulator [Patescibacteria group bacterium]MBU1075252.1 response regulator [Patescibacteria group bacterium]